MPKVIFITGISSGFGKTMSDYLNEKGQLVYGISRKQVENKQGVNWLKADVTDAISVNSAIELVLAKEGRIDVLINNAGIGISGPIEFTSAEDIRLQMETNFTGVVNAIKSVLPAMRQQREGLIINISSIGGIMGLPFQGFYSASKFAVEGLSESLRMELKPFNIKVVVVRPGDFFTAFTVNRRISNAIENNPFAAQFNKTLGIIETDERVGLKPKYLAHKIYHIIERKKPRNSYVISSSEQKLAVALKIFLPDSWFSSILESHYGIDKKIQ